MQNSFSSRRVYTGLFPSGLPLLAQAGYVTKNQVDLRRSPMSAVDWPKVRQPARPGPNRTLVLLSLVTAP